MPKRVRVLIPVLLALMLFGCAKAPVSNPPVVPTPPQVLVAQMCQAGAHTAALASQGFIAAHQAKALDDAAFATIARAIQAADKFFRDATTETASGDTWPQMRVKIAGLAAGSVISQTVSDPALQADLDAINKAIQNILGVQ